MSAWDTKKEEKDNNIYLSKASVQELKKELSERLQPKFISNFNLNDVKNILERYIDEDSLSESVVMNNLMRIFYGPNVWNTIEKLKDWEKFIEEH